MDITETREKSMIFCDWTDKFLSSVANSFNIPHDLLTKKSYFEEIYCDEKKDDPWGSIHSANTD